MDEYHIYGEVIPKVYICVLLLIYKKNRQKLIHIEEISTVVILGKCSQKGDMRETSRTLVTFYFFAQMLIIQVATFGITY